MALIRAAGLSCALMLGACASVAEVSPEPAAPGSISSLPPQTLAPGQCGLFGWDTAPVPNFVFFATEGRGFYLDGKGTEALAPQEPFPALRYGDLTLDLGPADAVADATRYGEARMTRTLDDGFEKVRPLIVLKTCQTDGPSTVLTPTP